ncbi:transporter substrate-binding domain-containing protein [Elstera litoralis]|uniref:transporter substrate-binding domain-containing protein n=1 Tax=Elstera litoralis TaxID=552518 RepID=UPI00069756F4|nr:transporter substrate-binding domain-containing protein [Elstera litoralis]
MSPQPLRFAYLIEPPFCYRDAEGRVTGYDVEIARHLLPNLGVPSIQFIETEFSELLDGLTDGRWAMTTGLFITEARRERVDFSRPIWELPDGLLIRSETAADIHGYTSLAQSPTRRLGIIQDQVQHQTARRLGVPNDRISLFNTYEAAAHAVRAGTIDAYASVALAHRGHLALNPDPYLTVVEVPSTEKPPERGGFAFAKTDASLRQAVDTALTAFVNTPPHHALAARFGFSLPA